MLVLTRKTNEAIQIGENIEIKIISVQGDQVKIGIEAPKNIEIHRQEIYKEIQSENTNAAKEVKDLLNLLLKTNKE
jgi:carbon storage regulator